MCEPIDIKELISRAEKGELPIPVEVIHNGNETVIRPADANSPVKMLPIVEIKGKFYYKDSRLKEYRSTEEPWEKITMLVCENCEKEFHEFEADYEEAETVEDWKAGFGAPLCRECWEQDRKGNDDYVKVG